MQVFATSKATAWGIAIALKLNCFKTKCRNAVIVMNLTAILLLVGCLQLSAKGISQTITISVKNADLQTVFTAIEKQTDYVFFVNKELLDKGRKVTIRVSNVSLQQVLDLCFKDQPFTYLIAGRMITISRRNDKTSINETIQTTNQSAQLVDIKGRVVNENSDPVEGVNVTVKGSQRTTSTNSNGEFLLNAVDENATLVFTSVNMETFDVKIKGKQYLDVTLQTRITAMQEVVINKGYYTESKRFSTGNVGKVTSKDIEKQPVNNPLLALQGRVPGVTVTQTSGLPGSGIIVRIQGQNSLQNGGSPFYIVDGVPISTEIPTPINTSISPFPNSGESYIRQTNSGRGNTLSFLNPSDIESIEILKDADATAIYGSRAANGAILITTKKGKSGKATFSADIQHGFGEVPHFMKLLNTPQYIEMRNEAMRNDGFTPSGSTAASGQSIYAPDLKIWDTTRQTDWQKELIGGTARYTHANASISGGSSEVQYLVGGSYHKETTVFPGDFSNQRGSMHLNLNNNNNIKSKFHFQISTSYSADKNKLPATDITAMALQLVPNAPSLYKEDGSLNWEIGPAGISTFQNPLAALFFRNYSSKTNNLIANGVFSYDVLPGLRISTSLGFTNLQSNDIQTNSLFAERPENPLRLERTASFGDSKLNTWSIEPQISYKRSIGKGKFDGLFGSSFQRSSKEAGYLGGTGFSNDQVMTNPQAAVTLTTSGYFKSLYKYHAIFSRLNYTYNGRYILNLTGRRDGSTRFGSNDKFHNFWSVGAGWIFSQENLFKGNKSFFSFGKLKGSYGTTGSDQIGDYRFLTLYTTVNTQVPYQSTAILTPGDIPNPYLQWEETKKLNLGLDLGFFNDRIYLTATYSRNRSSNQLIDYFLPRITGRSSVLLNFPATIENTNWEFTLNTENIKNRTFSWTTNINLTVPNNKLIKFPDLENSSYKNNYIIGKSISLLKLYKYTGVDPVSGLYSFSDVNGNVTTTPNSLTDLVRIFNRFQTLYGGVQNSIRYKSFQFDVLFQFVKQIALSPDFAIGFSPGQFFQSSSIGNQPASVMSRWQKAGDNTDIQKFSARNSQVDDSYFNATTSDKYYIDASYLRLKNLSLSWELPSGWIQKVHIQNCRLFVQAQNLITITNYEGLDPETPGFRILPPLRVVTFGINLKL